MLAAKAGPETTFVRSSMRLVTT